MTVRKTQYSKVVECFCVKDKFDMFEKKTELVGKETKLTLRLRFKLPTVTLSQLIVTLGEVIYFILVIAVSIKP